MFATVTLCGAPLVGKTQIAQRIAESNSIKPEVVSFDGDIVGKFLVEYKSKNRGSVNTSRQV